MESLTGKDQHRRSVRNMLFSTHRCQVSILQAENSSLARSSTAGRPSFHVHHDDKLDARVGHPTVHSDPLVEGVQEAKVVANGLCGDTGFEDVEAGVEHEGVFQLVPLGFVAWSGCREQRDVQRVVLGTCISIWTVSIDAVGKGETYTSANHAYTCD